jgi:antagonist of KipI
MLEILRPAVITSLQPAAPLGWMAFGVPASGPMDAFALRAANLLAGSPANAIAIEIGFSGAAFLALQDCLLAATGPGFSLSINGQPFRMWTSIYVRKNSLVELHKTDAGNWAYLAIHGGLLAQPGPGSRFPGLDSALRPAPLTAGQVIHAHPSGQSLATLASRHLPEQSRPAYTGNALVRVLPGPQYNQFSKTEKDIFFSAEYHITQQSDRLGYRLSGPALKTKTNVELVSEGMARGCIQVPPDGQPIVMQADSPTTGGYPKIASVISADQPLLAQLPVGNGCVHFQQASLEEAHAAMLKQTENLSSSIHSPETFPLF